MKFTVEPDHSPERRYSDSTVVGLVDHVRIGQTALRYTFEPLTELSLPPSLSLFVCVSGERTESVERKE